MELTILNSETFWDELIKRSASAECIVHDWGRKAVGHLLSAAFALAEEMKEEVTE